MNYLVEVERFTGAEVVRDGDVTIVCVPRRAFRGDVGTLITGWGEGSALLVLENPRSPSSDIGLAYL